MEGGNYATIVEFENQSRIKANISGTKVFSDQDDNACEILSSPV